MNILVSTVFSARGGGLSTHVGDLIGCMKKKGFQASRIDFDQAKIGLGCKAWCMLKALGNTDLGRKYMTLARVANLHSAIMSRDNTQNFDLIHCHDPVASYAALQMRPDNNIPVVETIHGPYSFEAQMWVNKNKSESKYVSYIWEIENHSFHNADRLIAVDTGQAKYAQKEFGIDPDKIDIIFNAVDAEEVRNTAAGDIDFEIPGKYIFVPRRHVSKNGVDVAIEALSHLQNDKDLKLVSAGGGPETENLKQLVDKLHLEDRVIFLGMRRRPEVLKLVKRAQAVLIPSKPSWGVVEATSIAAIEAMACGTPVIVSNIGGLAELVQDGHNGLTVPPSEPETLANAIRRVLQEDGLRESLSQISQTYVDENLDTKVWFNKVIQVYKKAGAKID